MTPDDGSADERGFLEDPGARAWIESFALSLVREGKHPDDAVEQAIQACNARQRAAQAVQAALERRLAAPTPPQEPR